MKTTALIMAGGCGERFWPRSRKSMPKQFLSLTGDGKTMIQLTVERILPIVNIEDIFIATNETYKDLVRTQLPDLPPDNILCEPVGRNTAPCIGLGAMHIASKYDDALMMVLPSDHLIKMEDIFVDTLSKACRIAEGSDSLVTIGIPPSYPETGYGYIKMDTTQKRDDSFKVDCFVEKPNLTLAREYVASGRYAWNSGMFIWKLSSILDNFSRHLPQMSEGLYQIKAAFKTPEAQKVLEAVFPELESISIDYGIMEKADNIYVIPGSFGWDDVGSWLAIERIKGCDDHHNTVTGNVITVDTNGCIIEANDKLIAAVGIKDIVIVDTDDAILISGKASTNNIKSVLQKLRESGSDSYL